jgi:hypothetical protein
LSPLPSPTLLPATLLPMPSRVLLPSLLHLSACNKEGNGKGGKSNGNGNKEGNGDGGKSNGDVMATKDGGGNGAKEGEDESGKRENNGDEEGKGEGGKRCSLHCLPPLSLLPLPSSLTLSSFDQHPCCRGLCPCRPCPHSLPSPSLLPSPSPSSPPLSSLLLLLPSPSLLLTTMLPLSSRVSLPLPLPLSPSLTRHPCCCSHCFHRHHPCHCHLIVVSKRWVMATAAAMACRRSHSIAIAHAIAV